MSLVVFYKYICFLSVSSRGSYRIAAVEFMIFLINMSTYMLSYLIEIVLWLI